MSTFQETFADQLQQACPPDDSRPVRVWACDESRFGLHTIRRRRITLRGVKPIGTHQHRFENTWVCGAVEPRSGASHFMAFPTLNTAMFQRFLDDFATTYPDSVNLIMVDNAACHKARHLRIPENVRLIFQPGHSPEVNPCERVWQAIKSAIAWTLFPDLAAVQQRLIEVFRSYSDAQLKSLTSYPYFVAAVTAQYS